MYIRIVFVARASFTCISRIISMHVRIHSNHVCSHVQTCVSYPFLCTLIMGTGSLERGVQNEIMDRVKEAGIGSWSGATLDDQVKQIMKGK